MQEGTEDKVKALVAERIEANDATPASIKVEQKGNQAFLVTVVLEGSDEERHGVVTADEVA